MKKWLALLIVLLLSLGAYVAAGPYLTVRAIRAAIAADDAVALSRQVDFPALRGSLKAQLSDRLVRAAGADAQSSAFGTIGLSLAGFVVEGAVDTMVTPPGLGAVMEGRKTWKFLGAGPESSASTATARPLQDAACRYESLSRFTMTVTTREQQPIVFVLTRRGLRWRLSDIRLPD